jgi:hypothetical protein
MVNILLNLALVDD